MNRVELESGQTLLNVHAEGTCAGEHCWVHNPSEHSMREFPRLWRDDWGIGFLERICPHGIGHPDPDSLAFLESMKVTGFDVHGCDGCCR